MEVDFDNLAEAPSGTSDSSRFDSWEMELGVKVLGSTGADGDGVVLARSDVGLELSDASGTLAATGTLGVRKLDAETFGSDATETDSPLVMDFSEIAKRVEEAESRRLEAGRSESDTREFIAPDAFVGPGIMAGNGAVPPAEDETVGLTVSVSDDRGDVATGADPLSPFDTEALACDWTKLSLCAVFVFPTTGTAIGFVAPVANDPLGSDRTELEALAVLVAPKIPAPTEVVAPVVIEGRGSDSSELDRLDVSVFRDAVAETDAVWPGKTEASESRSSTPGRSAMLVFPGTMAVVDTFAPLVKVSETLALAPFELLANESLSWVADSVALILISELEIPEGDSDFVKVEEITVFSPNSAKLISVALFCTPGVRREVASCVATLAADETLSGLLGVCVALKVPVRDVTPAELTGTESVARSESPLLSDSVSLD